MVEYVDDKIGRCHLEYYKYFVKRSHFGWITGGFQDTVSVNLLLTFCVQTNSHPFYIETLSA